MSVRIDKKTLTPADISKIKDDCKVEGEQTEYGKPPSLCACETTIHAIYIPLAYAKSEQFVIPKGTFPHTNYDFYSGKFPFRTDGGRDQRQVFKEATENIKKYKTTLLSLFCGYGKTYLAIRLSHWVKLKTAILTHRSVLTSQWVDSISTFTTGKVQIVNTVGTLDPTADFYIFNIAFVGKYWDKNKKKYSPRKLGAFKHIGTIIVDEAHVACANKMSRALLYFTPKVSIALTATPTRADKLDRLLELYFGEYSETRIIRIAQNPFIVYKFLTGIKPVFTKNKFGKKDWTSVISSLTTNETRNEQIIELIKKFNTQIILVLSKRTAHCNFLAKKLTEEGICCSVMVGISQTYDKTTRVLFSTTSKLGVGFDDPRLNMLIITCPIKEIEQYAGRLRDAPDKQRIIIDMFDEDYNCKKQWEQREAWYLSRCGIIKDYKIESSEEEELAPRKRLASKI